MPVEVIDTLTNEKVDARGLPRNGSELLNYLARRHEGLKDYIIKNARFEYLFLVEELIARVTFESCTFDTIGMTLVERTEDVVLDKCIVRGDDSWTRRDGVKAMSNCKINEPPTNEELEKIVHGKVFSLPNKMYVKVMAECDFCHKKYYEVMSRKNPHEMLRAVPQSDRRVCDECYRNYDLSSKIMGNRTYGWHGPLSFYRTPMDKRDTEIMGLEMEYEGKFWDWKGLQDAHRGHLHYGYDSSVDGQNELSWDCGSYSYWKYLAPLEDVCKAIEKGGGKAGPTAGIHIHVSTPNTDVRSITHTINQMCQNGDFKTMMECVSLRRDKEKFERYACLTANADSHHAGVSYNGHGTCEFRVFNSSLNHKIILRHIKFCKEFYSLVRARTPKDKILESFSKETKKHIIACANAQVEVGFVTKSAAEKMVKKLGAI